MMTLFKSKYYFRIIDKIADLENEVADIETERNDLVQTLTPAAWTHYSIRIADLQMRINTLRGLL
jgi:phage host-nuclease inhibitor protein Gam